MLLLVGAAGLALIIADNTVVWRRIQILNDLVLMLIFFISGAALPFNAMPDWALGWMIAKMDVTLASGRGVA